MTKEELYYYTLRPVAYAHAMAVTGLSCGPLSKREQQSLQAHWFYPEPFAQPPCLEPVTSWKVAVALMVGWADLNAGSSSLIWVNDEATFNRALGELHGLTKTGPRDSTVVTYKVNRSQLCLCRNRQHVIGPRFWRVLFQPNDLDLSFAQRMIVAQHRDEMNPVFMPKFFQFQPS